ncbi:hypothetical protein M758_7G115100 [Ceratodon purpureus]|nr:hypothetical protein M758_7G115100 [Ceratodon purpureus]
MFSVSGSPDGVSLHRSPPYASKTRGPAEESPGISSPGISPGGRLQLTVKSPYASKAAPVIEKFVDPSPDWSLQDLQLELDVIASRYTSTVSLDNTPPPSTARGISWRELSVTADFGMKSGPFRMSAFDTDSETESSDEEDDSPAPTPTDRVDAGNDDQSRKATSRGSEVTPAVAKEEWERSPLLGRTGYVESALIELERERHHRVQEEFRKRRFALDNALKEEVQREAALLARVEKEKEAKCELARRSDKQDQRQIAELRDEHLSALQRDHELRSQFEARQIRKEAAEEEARRQEIAAKEERERQIKARIQAEKDKAEAEAAKRKAQADAAAAAASKRAEDDRKSKEDQSAKEKESLQKNAIKKEPTIKTPTGLKPKVAPTAAQLEESRFKNLQAFQDVYAPLRANPAHQKELKTYERQIIKYLQQIAATQEQVKIKSRDLLQLLNDTRVPTQFLLVTLGTKLLSQCEVQVMKLPSFAFALAQVIVNVASQVPQVMDIVLAKLHEVCIYTVPKYYLFTKDQFESDAAYYKALGYREEDGKLESTDDYVGRMAAYMAFYGAMIQTEVAGGQNPHGLAAGWAWCARLLNNIPADRNTAVALEAFLKMAGFRLYQVYPKPFMRVMQAIVTEFIEKLKINGDADARAVVSRLETYLHLQKYLQEPDGRKMPATDVSSTLKA